MPPKFTYEHWELADEMSLFQCPDCMPGDMDMNNNDELFSFTCWECGEIQGQYLIHQLFDAIKGGEA